MNYAEIPVETAALTGMAVAVHAACKPELPAIIDRTGEYSWDYLNKRSNQLANYIRRLGLGTDDSVASGTGTNQFYARSPARIQVPPKYRLC